MDDINSYGNIAFSVLIVEVVRLRGFKYFKYVPMRVTFVLSDNVQIFIISHSSVPLIAFSIVFIKLASAVC